jgi:hypothetical protein
MKEWCADEESRNQTEAVTAKREVADACKTGARNCATPLQRIQTGVENMIRRLLHG